MQTRHRNTFITIKTEGAILPPDLLQRISGTDDSLDGLLPADYHLLKNEKLNEAINRSWNRLIGAWESFQTSRDKVAEGQPGTTATRERWLLPLFQELDYGRLQTSTAFSIDGKTYPISHVWGKAPIHLLGFNVELDKRTARVAGAAKTSPHSMVQEFLNRSDDHLWAFLSNGLQLRILRDNVSLTRQADVEFDLQGMMDGEVYADFVLLWLLCHQSRVEGEKPEEFWLEKWSREAHEQGTRALDQLRSGVEDAISHLGSGFLTHPANHALRDSLRAGSLSTQDYYRQLLRLVYRLIFLFVAEDRDLLFSPDSDQVARQRYSDYYSTRRLRRLAERSRGLRHSDLYHTLRLVTEKLGSLHGCAELALPALGSFLFSENSTPDLDQAELPNRHLLDAVRSLAYTEDKRTLRPVDYKNLGPEELGSVYESLLELHPELNVDAGTFSLTSASGHERKTTGSYYTPASLIRVLLDSALDPVIDDRLNAVKSEPLEAQEATLLDIKVCDPASGSGHFLIAAAHRLAKRLASLRTGTDEPPPEATRTALRDVIGHCIYGVDINPMAVELCKVSLWMEALEPGKPLSFLDAHIKCGNSLVGVGPGMEIEEIPDDAFRPAFGDDKPTATALRRRNKREREGQLGFRWDVTLIKDHEDLTRWIEAQAIQLEAMPEEEIRQVHAKAETYNASLESEEYIQGRLEYDLWTASFFWPIPKGDAENMLAPTQQELLRLRKSDDLDAELVRSVREIAEKKSFFHWDVEFPTVFHGEDPGFDVVLGNPPWERVKIQDREWFAAIRPDIANTSTAAARKKLINQLEEEDPILFARYKIDKQSAEAESLFVRNSGRYPLSGRGDINTYPLFVELGEYSVFSRGRIGLIVKTGIIADYSMRDFFAHLVESKRLVSGYDFSNKKLIFPAVIANERFTLLTLTGSSGHSKEVELSILNENIEDLKTPGKIWVLSNEDFLLINPNTRTCPLFQVVTDADIVRKVYQRLPIFIKEMPEEENLWDSQYIRMFDLTNDSSLFRSLETLQANTRIPPSPEWKTLDETYLTLYEGKLFDSYDFRHGDFDNIQINKRFGTKAEPNHPDLMQKNDPYYQCLPRHWVSISEVNSRYKDKLGYKPSGVLVFRDVCRTHTDFRTVRASVCPPWGFGNSAPILLFPKSSPEEHARKSLIICSNMLAFPFDYVARQKFAGGHLNKYILIQLPFIRPEPSLCPWNQEYDLFEWIIVRSLELSYTTWDLTQFALDCGYDGPPFKWDEKRRFLLRCELDAAYFHLYGIDRINVDYIMETFTIAKSRDIEKYGEYRTKLLILEFWDQIQEAIASGTNYVSTIDPPPADPNVAHLMRDRSVYDGPGFVPVVEPIDQQKSQTRQVLKEVQPTAIKETYPSKPTKNGALPIENSTQTSDYTLYKCNGCGQMVMGFDQENHTQQMHSGEDPGYLKL